MASSNDEIRGVLVQVAEERLLLPNATVAEVLARVRAQLRIRQAPAPGVASADEARSPADVQPGTVLAGRYQQANRLARDLRGSANKTVHFLTRRYTAADLQGVPPAELIISPGGEIIISGIDPPA